MLLQARQIRKSYGGHTVLKDISLQIHEGERIGLVGVNGAGKSTLLQILAGKTSEDAGEIHKSKETTIGYLAQNSGISGHATIWNEMLSVFRKQLQTEQKLREMEARMADPSFRKDNRAFEELMAQYDRLSESFRREGGYEIEARIRGVLHGMGFADISFDTPASRLSGGQKTRLALCKLLLSEPDILLLDEPTNHLDLDTLVWLEDYLKHYPNALLVVSHDRYFLDAIVHTIYEIDRSRARKYTGNYSRFVKLKAAEYESEWKQYQKQQEEIASMEDFIRRNIARASTSNRAKSRRKALERMEILEKPSGDPKKTHFRFETDRMSGKDVLKVENLGFSYEKGKPLLKSVHFQLERGESVALIGANGTGKTTLFKILTGQLQPDTGTCEWGSNVKIAYYDQEQRDLNPENTVLEEVWSAFPHLEEVRIRTVLGNFLFSGEEVEKKIAALSGGEKARVSLAKLMLKKANVLILDEPTNHLDIYSKEVLESALMDFEGTLLFISHDRYFLNKLAERVLELTPEGIRHFLGNFDDVVEKKKEMEELREEPLREEQNKASSAAGTAGKTEDAPTSYEERKKARREERNRQRRAGELEAKIEQLEERMREIEREIALPEISRDYVKLQEKNDELESIRQALEQAYEEWEALL